MPIHVRRLNQAHDGDRSFTAAQRSGKQPVGASECPWLYLILDLIVVDGHSTTAQVAGQIGGKWSQ